MLKAIICASCGATIRADRARCLRCGEPLREASPAGAASSFNWRSWPTLALVTSCVALAGVSLAYFGRATAPASVSVRAAVAGSTVTAPVASPATTADVSASRALQPDPVAVAFDNRRAGAVAYNLGDISGALAGFRAAADANPEDPIALNNVGQVLVRDGRAAEAIEYFDRAIALSPGTWSYRFNRARAYAEIKEWPRAIAGYREASQMFPGDYATEFNLAKALQANGDLAGAIAGFERAIALAPGQADFHLSYGLALEAVKRPAEAIAAYRRYLELEPAASDADRVKAHIAQLEGLKS